VIEEYEFLRRGMGAEYAGAPDRRN
jgi:hypothetical protein